MQTGELIGHLLYKRRSAACFFLGDQREPAIEELAARAGVKDLRIWPAQSPNDEEGDGVSGTWGPIDLCTLCLERRPRHYLFEIQFLLYRLWHLDRDRTDPRELPLEEERYYPLVLAFRDACRALAPQMAILTRLEQQDHRWVRERIEDHVRNYEPDALVRPSGLIYLDEQLYCGWEHYNNPAMPHDRVPTDQGVLVFAGQGRKRWF